MRASRAVACLGVAALVLGAAPAAWGQQPEASVARSFDELNRRLTAGETVRVLPLSGVELRGELRGFERGQLVVEIDGSAVTFSEQDVRTITWEEKDSLRNGVVVGMVVGAGGLLGFSALVCLSDYCNLTNAGAVLLNLGVGGFAGLTVGALIDHAIRTDRTVYRGSGSPTLQWHASPIIAPSAGGVSVVIRF